MTDEDAAILRQAANELTRLSNQFRGLLELGPVLQRIGSLPQAEAEVRARIAKANDEHEAIRERNSFARLNAEQDIARQHKTAADELNAKLRDKRTELTNIQSSYELVRAKLKTAHEDHNSLSLEIAEKKSVLEGLGEQIEEKVRALKAVQDQHKALVASISGIK